ncbi:MAG: acyl-CoA dehydrogenase family protein [Pseudomonadota bacterium]
MQLLWNDQQNKTWNQFAEIGHEVARRAPDLRGPGGLDHAAWRALTDAGLWQLPISRDLGGMGQSWWEFVAGFEGLASTARDLGFLLSVLAHAGALRVVSEAGSDAQKEKFLPRLMRGDVASTAATEVHGGSDVSRVQTAASIAGNELALSGRKTHITNAPIAEIFVIVGRVPSLGAKKDITLFLLDRQASGLSTGTPEELLGHRTSPTGDIFLDKVPIGEENILGPAGDGLTLLYQMLSFDRTLFGLISGSYARPIVQDALALTASRESFGRPLQEHQYVQDKIVRMKTNMEIARFVSYAALDELLRGRTNAALLSSIAKLVGSEGLCESAQEFLQLQGHAGYMEGEAGWIVRDTLATRIAGGTNEMQKVSIFNQLKHQSQGEALQ